MKIKRLLTVSLTSLLVAFSSVTAVSCSGSADDGKKTTAYEEKKLADFVDYASELKFDKNSGRKYMEFTASQISSLIDGDTSHFKVDSSKKSEFPAASSTYEDGILKVRYLAIDTPESTGQIQEWGKTASLYNKERLSNAESIIVESNDSNWNLDSTGTRFLGFVWYKAKGATEYKNLNLELLQEGLANAKSIGSTCYADIMQKAYSQANEHELYVFSKAAASWKIAKKQLTDSKSNILGNYNTSSIISYTKADTTDEIHKVNVYSSKGDLIDAQVTITDNYATNSNYYLGMEADGKVYYYTGEINSNAGEVTDDLSKAQIYKIAKDSTKSGYFNIYRETDDGNQYVTIDSSNNLSYMYRDKNFYYGDFISVTIKELRTSLLEGSENSYLGKTIRFEGIITSIDAETIYLQDYDEESGVNWGMTVYLGYSFKGTSMIVKGNKLSVCGSFQKYDTAGTYQVSGLTYMAMDPTYEKNTYLVEENCDYTPTIITGDDFSRTTKEDLYGGTSYMEALTSSYCKMENVTCTSVYTTADGTSAGALSLTCTDASGKTFTIRTSVLYNNGAKVTGDAFLNKTFDAIGIVDSYNGAYQLRVVNYNNITFKN